MSNAELTKLRDEIDAIDQELLALLGKRSAISGRVRVAKAGDGVKLRPGREAKIMRALLVANKGYFAERSLLRIWREIFSASLASQGAYSTAVLAQGGDSVIWDLAYDHFGAGGTFTRCTTSRRVLEAVAHGEEALGVLPTPDPADENPWWQHLLIQPEAADAATPPRIIARLPFWKSGKPDNGETAVVVAAMEPDPSGDDRTFMAIDLAGEVSQNRLAGAISDAGFDATFAARWHEREAPERWVNLIDLAGFAESDDARFNALANTLDTPVNQILRLGCYAVPSDIDDAGDC